MHNFFHCIDNILISGTTAEISRHFFLNFLSGQFFSLFQKDCRRHNKTRCTESTLNCTLFNKGLLNSCQFSVFFKTFQCTDIFSFCPDSQINTGINRFAVNDHGTGSTFPYFTAFFDGSKAEMITEHIQQRFSRIYILCNLFSVYHALNKYFLFFHAFSPPCCFTFSASSTVRLSALRAISPPICRRKSLEALHESRGCISLLTLSSRF